MWYFCITDIAVLIVLTPVLNGSTFARRHDDWGLRHLGALVGVAGFSVLGQQWMALGLRHVPSALGTIVVQTETVHAFILQALFFGHVSIQSFGGAALICASTGMLACVELRAATRLPAAANASTDSTDLEEVEDCVTVAVLAMSSSAEVGPAKSPASLAHNDMDDLVDVESAALPLEPLAGK